MVGHILISATLLVLAITANAGNVLLNAGGNQLTNIAWRCDTGSYANAGSKHTSNRKITVPGSWGPVYQSHRWVSTGDLEYKIPVPDGIYTVFLMWSETWTGSGIGVRQFTVKINDELQADGGKFNGTLDVWKASGGLDKPYFFNAGQKVPKNGFITVTLGRIPGKNNPMLSGLAILGNTADQIIRGEGVRSCTGGSPTPTTTPTVTKSPSPTAGVVGDCTPDGDCGEATVITGRFNNGAGFVMNVGGAAAANIAFGADNINYIEEADIGFVAKAPVAVIDNGKWGEPHQTHRYTKGPTLTYKIPVPAGNYHIGLLFTESFKNAAGQRTFDIIINDDLKAKAFDVFKANGGKNKPGYKGINGIKSVSGFIKIQFKKVLENPFVNGIFIKGVGAGSLAIGGPDAGPCAKKCQDADPCKNQEIGTDFAGKHAAHAVAGGPYVETDFKKDGLVTVNLDGGLSHSHFALVEKIAEITKWEWRWKQPSNPLADKTTGIVKAYGSKVTANFPLGTTNVTLLVTDDFCNAAEETTTVTVNSATMPGAYCYYYDLGMQSPATVPLPVNAKLNPKPMKGLNVGDINFANTAAFGEFPFKPNTFAVRCQFFLDVKTAGELQYKVIHSGPVKVYHAGALVGSSDSKAANQMTITKKEATVPGVQEWQILYLRPKGTEGKLIFQFSDGQVIPTRVISHDSSATLPVIVNLSKTIGLPEQLLKIFGSAFVNGVKVKFGSKDAIPLEGSADVIEVRAPTGFVAGTTVAVTVTTAAGVSNGYDFTYTDIGLPPLKFKEDTVKNPDGTPYVLSQITVLKYGPDGRLYCGARNSKIYALTLDKDLKVAKKCQRDVFESWPRSVLGLGFDPKTSDLKLYFTTSTLDFKKDKFILEANGWQNGKVKSVTMKGPEGCFNNDVKDVVTGLPVADHDHGVHAIEFLPDGKMLIGVGGVTNGGLPGIKFGDMASNPLSGAIVECPSTGTDMIYSSTDPLKANIIGGSCKVYAAGFRNTFGMSYFTNNKLYATDNGPNQSYGEFSTNCAGGQKTAVKILDKLFLVQPGKCHGHPNINRGLNGFPDQCVFENPECVQPIISGLKSSTNGIMEYRSNIFGAEAKGNMFLSMFATGTDEGRVSRVILDQSGRKAPNGFTGKFYPKSGLSVVEGPRGEIVMSRVYGTAKTFIVLKPDYPKPKVTLFISVMPRRGPATGGATVLVTGHNFGSAPSAKFGMKACTDVSVIDDDSFTCVTPPGSEDSQVKIEVTGTTGVGMGPGFDYWYF